MKLMLSSFWRAAAYCVHPKIILLSLIPIAILAAGFVALGVWAWDPAQALVSGFLDSWSLAQSLWTWLESVGLAKVKVFLVPILVILLATPVIILACLMGVAIFITPAILQIISKSRFKDLAIKNNTSWVQSAFYSFGVAFIAILLLLISLPFWLFPPVAMLVPPLIWGWLTYKVMTFDALSLHATQQERKLLVKTHRGPLLVIGILAGYLSAAPSMVWFSSAIFATVFVFLIPLAIWLYTLVFAFTSLWFAFYCLTALEEMRNQENAPKTPNNQDESTINVQAKTIEKPAQEPQALIKTEL